MKNNKIETNEYEERIRDLEEQGKTAMLIGLNKKLIGLIAVADTLKEHSREAVEELKVRKEN